MPIPGVALYWTTEPSTGGLGLDLTGGAEDIGDVTSGEPCTEDFEASWYGNEGAIFQFENFNLQSGFVLESFEYQWGVDGRQAFDEDDTLLALVEDFVTGWNAQAVQALTGYHEALLEDFTTGWSTSTNVVPAATTAGIFTGMVAYDDCETWTSQLVW